MSRKGHQVAARARLTERLLAQGLPVPDAWKATPYLIRWRCAARPGCRLLTVHLTRDGWVLDGEDYRAPMPEWIRLQRERGITELNGVDVTLENLSAGRFTASEPGKVEGVQHRLPLDVDQWTRRGQIPLGCDHGHGQSSSALLAEDCLTVRRTGRRLKPDRRIEW